MNAMANLQLRTKFSVKKFSLKNEVALQLGTLHSFALLMLTGRGKCNRKRNFISYFFSAAGSKNNDRF